MRSQGVEIGDFGPCWARIRADLAAGDRVRNWSQLGGYLGGEFTIQGVEAGEVVVDPPDAKSPKRVPREDFAAVWEHWDDYCAGEVQRQELRDMTWFSTYVISILHHVLEGDGSTAADSLGGT